MESDFYYLWIKRYLTYFSESGFSEIHISDDLKKAIDELYSHERTQIRMRSRNRLLSPLINKAHEAMPVPIRIRLYRALQKILDKKRNNGHEDYWYLDRSYVSIKKRIDEEVHRQGFSVSAPWSKTKPVCITHDIDTKYCMEKGIFDLLEIEERHGIPSTIFLVPESGDYEIDERIFSFKQVEIGSHGLKHDGSFDLISADEREMRIKKSKKMLDRGSSNVTSFRAPWLLRTADMYTFLHSAGYTVSSSFMDIETQMWFGGCRWNYPTQPLLLSQEGWHISPIVELPITAPMDWSVFVGRKLAPEKVLKIFTLKYEFVKNVGGLSVFLFHPAKYDTGKQENLKIYDKFIERLASDGEIDAKTLVSVAKELKNKKRYVEVDESNED